MHKSLWMNDSNPLKILQPDLHGFGQAHSRGVVADRDNRATIAGVGKFGQRAANLDAKQRASVLRRVVIESRSDCEACRLQCSDNHFCMATGTEYGYCRVTVD